MTTWTVEEEDQSVVVRWMRCRKRFDSEAEALKFIRNNRSATDRVIRVDKDGYTTPVTRKRWRRRGTHL